MEQIDSWSLRIAGLPNSSATNLHNIHFLCCSYQCDELDMAKPLVEDLNDLEMSGIMTYDAFLGCWLFHYWLFFQITPGTPK